MNDFFTADISSADPLISNAIDDEVVAADKWAGADRVGIE